MIKFFRKIRQKLLSEGKTGTYFKYAIGEILLVMIGILLALQVNDWNEARKQEKKEKQILRQLKNELNEDYVILNEIIGENEFIITSCNVLLEHLENDLAYHDGLAVYFDGWATPSVLEFNSSTYQNLITTGPGIVTNDSLRNSILKLYNYHYTKAKTFNDYYKSDFHSFIAPIQLQNVEAVEWGKSSVPIDYEGLKQNTLFINALKWTKNGHRVNNLVFDNLQELIRELIVMIEDELAGRK